MSLAGRNNFRLTYEISPIVLVGGIAEGVNGLPIISITQAQDFNSALSQSQSGGQDLNDYFAHFKPLPGATLISNDLGRYPFANQTVAANAVIAQPLRVSLLMIAPARNPGSYSRKLAQFSAVQRALQQHTNQGGVFTVATPSFVYTNCILLQLRDTTGDDGHQVQTAWQWDFEQPLLTVEQAQQAYSSMLNRMNNRVRVEGDPPNYSGAANSVGNTAAPVLPSLVPASSSLGGAFGSYSGVIREPSK